MVSLSERDNQPSQTEAVMSKGKVLVIGSNATQIEIQGGGFGATGQYLNETVIPALAGRLGGDPS